MSTWLVDRSSRLLARRTSRRSFLTTSAVVGSALALSPWDYLLRPGTAYAQIVGCAPGALCNDGYTDFCCTINGGRNECPPGSVPAGWWRAAGTRFCAGDRYYIDCNDFTAHPPGCRCANGCDTRKVYCNRFRYGQCHQELPGTGIIACRVVTCTPPWQLDPACTTASATDEATQAHTAPCLEVPPIDWAGIAAFLHALAGYTLVGDSVSWDRGHVELLVRVLDGRLARLRRVDGEWREWEVWASTTDWPVEIASWGRPRLDVFWRSRGNALVWRRRDGSGWSAERVLAGGMTSAASAAVMAPNRMHVVFRGVDGALNDVALWDGAWTPPYRIGGSLTTPPAAISIAPDRLDVFYRGHDNALWYRTLTTSHGWYPESSLGGQITSTPSVVSIGGGEIHAFVRGGEGWLWFQRFRDGTWSGWQGLGDNLSSPPVAVARDGRIDVCWRGPDSGLWYRTFVAGVGWYAASPLGGFMTSAPTVASPEPGQLEVFYRGRDGTLVHRRYINGRWSGEVVRGIYMGAPFDAVG